MTIDEMRADLARWNILLCDNLVWSDLQKSCDFIVPAFRCSSARMIFMVNVDTVVMYPREAGGIVPWFIRIRYNQSRKNIASLTGVCQDTNSEERRQSDGV